MSTMTEPRRGMLEMVAAMVLMGTVGYFVVEAGQNAHDVVFYRCLFGAGFLALYCWARGYFRGSGLTRKALLMAAASGVFLVLNWVMLFASFKTASISTATVIYHTQPFFFVIMGAIFLRDALTLDKTVWILLAFIGVVLVVNVDPADLTLSSTYVFGVALALSAAVFYAITSIIVKQLKAVRPHVIALVQVAVGAVILFPFANMDALPGITGVQWSYLLVLGAVHTCLTYILMYSAFQKLTTPVIAVLSFIYPAVAILVDYVAYDESLDATQMLGVVLILFSSFAVSQNLPAVWRNVSQRVGSLFVRAPRA
jgi:drug/metabolite transporter (DMT)-like permease